MAETVDGLEDLALTWSGRALDVGRIEAELGKLRYMAAGAPAEGQGFALRTSFLNMVIYAEHPEGAQYASSIIEDLATHHPSRALIVVAHPHDGESHIEAQLAAHSHMSQALEQSVCCEEVTLHVAGPAARHLHSIIIPLLIPDLPVYLWWTEQLPQEPHLFQELLETADRLIIDSARFEDQPAALQRLAALSARETRAAVGDVNWQRLHTWRDLLSEQRSVAEMRHHLSSVKSVEIRYAKGHGGSKAGSAFLFLAWLAGELGWDTHGVSAHSSGRLTLRADEGRRVSAFIHAVDYPTLEPGRIVGVKIACQSETARALLSINRTGDPYHLTIRTEHRDGITEDSVRIEPGDAAGLLVRELDTAPQDGEFARVLNAALPLMMAARA